MWTMPLQVIRFIADMRLREQVEVPSAETMRAMQEELDRWRAAERRRWAG